MKKTIRNFAAAIAIAISFAPLHSCGGDDEPSDKVSDPGETYEVVPYVWSDGDRMPDPSLITGLTYIGSTINDMGSGEAHTHHTSLRRSYLSGYTTVEEAIERYRKKGVPYDRMMLGLAFYGRGNNKEFKDWTDYRYITPGQGMTEKWDDVACVPYITNSSGELIISYDNPRSIAIKCDYIKEKGFRGAMVWRAEYDTDDYVMAHAVADGLLNDK